MGKKKTHSLPEPTIWPLPKSRNPIPDELIERRIREMLAKGEDPLKGLVPEGLLRDDALATVEEIYAKIKRYQWAPDSPGAVAIALKRAKLMPHIAGRGQGSSSRWWLQEAIEALKKSRKKSPKSRAK
jgi:hypothetical protein